VAWRGAGRWLWVGLVQQRGNVGEGRWRVGGSVVGRGL